jgi:antitoxin CcdA
MQSSSSSARKRPVNLTLTQTIVNEARLYSNNLSNTVDELLAEYVVNQKQARAARQQQADAVVAELNALHDRIGSIADEFSPL